ncbi:hypothetical protein Ahia01_000538000, partial [Argonauta hians]
TTTTGTTTTGAGGTSTAAATTTTIAATDVLSTFIPTTTTTTTTIARFPIKCTEDILWMVVADRATDCRHYFRCKFGRVTRCRCPFPLVFSSYYNRCTYVQFPKC